MTVGADGIGSVVARRSGARRSGRGGTRAPCSTATSPASPTDGYEWAYGDGAAAGLIPTNDGETCVFVAHHARADARAAPDHGRRLLSTTLLGASAPASWPSRPRRATRRRAARAGRACPGFVRRSWGPGWALVGDAGYFKDPITTHGMTDALRDAELLAARSCPCWAAGRTRERLEALARYQAAAGRSQPDLFAVTEEVASYDWDTARIRALLRRVSSAMSDEVDLLGGAADPASAPGAAVRLTPLRWPVASTV